jgi:hypothetical protein
MLYPTIIAASNAQLREKQAGALKTAAPASKRAGVCLTLMLILMLSALLAVPVSANSINAVEIWATIHSDGSATMKEVWDVYITDSSNTEWYVAKHNLDNMDILDLSVQEDKSGSPVPFETLSVWDENASRAKKAGKCGLLRANGGYEICWGFGELGYHKYTVAYTITNIVKGYQGGDAMRFNFLSEPAGGVDSLNIHLSADGFSLTAPATRVWVFGYHATSSFVNGGITVLGSDRFLQSDYAAILLAFDPSLLSPADRRTETLDEIINLNMEGGIWEKPKNDSFDDTFVIIIAFTFPVIIMFIITRKRRKQFRMIRKAPYCRELPFEGNIGATYARLCDIYRTNGGRIIGCFLLKWLQTGQVEIVTNTYYGEPTIRLHAARADLPLFEASMYSMFMAAAGQDMILRNNDLKKWAYKNHRDIKRWLLEYRAFYKNELVQMGVYEVVPVKHRFKTSTETEFCDTPLAQDMTLRAFGFKRYLEDFTRVNEREAREGGLPAAGCSDWPFQSVNEREVREVWDQYLIFAQLFGIADCVAEQFKELFPNNFYQNDLRYIGGSLYMASIVVSNSFSQSMQQVYMGGFAGGAGGFAGGGGAGGR